MAQLEKILGTFNIDTHEDIVFLYKMAAAVEHRTPKWQSRTDKGLELALAMNQDAKNLVDPQQLTVAQLAHDIAMGFLPLEVLEKPGKLNAKERKTMRGHIKSASDLVHRMQKWEPARQMILSHHEWVDGTGYPQGRKEDEISNGAKILAIVDTFTAQSSGNLMHSVMEIHRFSGIQFSKIWVHHFEQAVKKPK